jgi:hypothetical protein
LAIERLAASIIAFDNTLPQATPFNADSKFHQQSDFSAMGSSSGSDPAVCTAKFELNNGTSAPIKYVMVFTAPNKYPNKKRHENSRSWTGHMAG